MYTVEDLKKFDYFKDVNINHALDSLTGVLSRGYILGFTKHLIDNKIPFTMGIIDIDNFKLVNDNYGHDFGDQCLLDMANNLSIFFKDNGLVGRYGGDEFIFLYFGDTSYDNVRNVISDMYTNHMVTRKRFKYNDVEHWVTSTTGCASYPKDAEEYTQLFATIDKTLYRGKAKGRNCFIIYVEEKHKNIDVHKKETSYLPIIYSNINNIYKSKTYLSSDEVVQGILDYLINILHYTQAIYIKKDGSIITNNAPVSEKIKNTNFDFVANLLEDDDIYIPEEMNKLRSKNENFEKLFENFHFITFMASKVRDNQKLYGYLILFEGKIERIWQEKDISILMYLDKLIQLLYNKN